MPTPPRSTPPPAAAALSWMIGLAARMLAGLLNMPEPLVCDTGAFVYARVQAAEHRAAKTLRPVRLRRLLLALVRPSR
jgi:hypothetical protein